MTVCGSWWCVGETTISLTALVEGQHNLHRHRVLTVSVPCTPSPVWLKRRCFQLVLAYLWCEIVSLN